jgi:hypothetical protein
MPNIALLGSIKINMYHRDHSPPHFHAINGNDEALIRIADLGIERGTLPPNVLAVVRGWAANHQPELAMNWVLGLAGLPMRSIAFP